MTKMKSGPELWTDENPVRDPPDRTERHAVSDSFHHPRRLRVDGLEFVRMPPEPKRPALLLVDEPRLLAEHHRVRRDVLDDLRRPPYTSQRTVHPHHDPR